MFMSIMILLLMFMDKDKKTLCFVILSYILACLWCVVEFFIRKFIIRISTKKTNNHEKIRFNVNSRRN